MLWNLIIAYLGRLVHYILCFLSLHFLNEHKIYFVRNVQTVGKRAVPSVLLDLSRAAGRDIIKKTTRPERHPGRRSGGSTHD